MEKENSFLGEKSLGFNAKSEAEALSEFKGDSKRFIDLVTEYIENSDFPTQQGLLGTFTNINFKVLLLAVNKLKEQGFIKIKTSSGNIIYQRVNK